MKVLKRVFDFYIQSSIHVALSAYSLVQMTHFMFPIPNIKPVANFAFFGTIVGYNFVKYEALARAKSHRKRDKLKSIAVLSFLSFLAVGFYFFQLQRLTQMVSVAVFILTLLYTLPFFPNRKNARNWAGVKIYIVSFCWVGVTLILPILDAGISITMDFYLKCMQRFILIFVLILIFEIIDLANDDPHLQTVPQQIGVRRTKNLGYILLLIFCVLEFFNSKFNFHFFSLQLLLVFAIAIIVALFLAFVNENRSKYYTSFWVESVPILWWWLVLVF
ncbi:MAG TPA: hypothetical protein PLO52_01835 [Flavobacterium alvei]|nr:hypothetical protein [Flavobacterium alvei]HQF47297.1 hypothetical protein [Flavobacterium alvei]HQK38838.1 hypothetical protein [Flavobacterium alvei]